MDGTDWIEQTTILLVWRYSQIPLNCSCYYFYRRHRKLTPKENYECLPPLLRFFLISAHCLSERYEIIVMQIPSSSVYRHHVELENRDSPVPRNYNCFNNVEPCSVVGCDCLNAANCFQNEQQLICLTQYWKKNADNAVMTFVEVWHPLAQFVRGSHLLNNITRKSFLRSVWTTWPFISTLRNKQWHVK
jgi:hypothetical protein